MTITSPQRLCAQSEALSSWACGLEGLSRMLTTACEIIRSWGGRAARPLLLLHVGGSRRSAREGGVGSASTQLWGGSETHSQWGALPRASPTSRSPDGEGPRAAGTWVAGTVWGGGVDQGKVIGDAGRGDQAVALSCLEATSHRPWPRPPRLCHLLGCALYQLYRERVPSAGSSRRQDRLAHREAGQSDHQAAPPEPQA